MRQGGSRFPCVTPVVESSADKALHQRRRIRIPSNINDGAPLLKQPTLAVSAKKVHCRPPAGFHMWNKCAVNLGVNWKCMALAATDFFVVWAH